MKDDEARKFLALQRKLGLKNSTEVIRFLIHKEAEKLGPEMEHYNLNEQGVRILDRNIRRVVDIFFTPNGIRCDHCETNDCKHINFALEIPEVKKVIRQKRKDSWDLPDV